MLPFYRYLGTLPQTDTHNQIAAVWGHGDGYPVLPKVLSFGFVGQIHYATTDIKALRCVRSRMVEQRTAISNQIRALAMEYGVVFPQGITTLLEAVTDALADRRTVQKSNWLPIITRDTRLRANQCSCTYQWSWWEKPIKKRPSFIGMVWFSIQSTQFWW